MNSLIRWVLPVLLGLNGAMMLVAPGPWYEAVPGVTGTGPFNSHFIRDIGAAYLACAAGLGWWAARRTGPAGAESAGRRGPGRQLRDARASFHVVDGRMTSAAFAGSGW